MEPILCGIETEYGFQVEGIGPEDQVEEAAALVRSYLGERVSFWNDKYESPRNDLRGFKLDRLARDPIDARFEAKSSKSNDDRADQILANGARFYNDHGHPEYATPECNDAFQAAVQDRVGEFCLIQAASEYGRATGREVKVFKNNTDFHGAAYGTHENYLVPRSIDFEQLRDAVLPMLVFRPILCGAGKVGAESGELCRFQMSQRADFFMEPVNAETLYRRPIFNTRDESHARVEEWIRLHVIAGDANMSIKGTARKLALAKLAIQLAIAGKAPDWRLRDPVAVAKRVSRDLDGIESYELEGGGSITAVEALESYFQAAENQGWLELALQIGAERQSDPYLAPYLELNVIHECRDLLRLWKSSDPGFARHVDWAAKLALLEMFEYEQGEWDAVGMSALDLAFTDIDRDSSLFWALVDQGGFDDNDFPASYASMHLSANSTGTRSEIRSYAIQNFGIELVDACWRTLTFQVGEDRREVDLRPDWHGTLAGMSFSDVESFIEWIEQQP